MSAEPVDLARVTEGIDALRREVARLSERVAALEGPAGVSPAAPAAPAPAAAPPTQPIGEELMVVISAAVAAFLGKRPHVRQVRLLGSAAWAQQGRVTIQASHALSGHHR